MRVWSLGCRVQGLGSSLRVGLESLSVQLVVGFLGVVQRILFGVLGSGALKPKALRAICLRGWSDPESSIHERGRASSLSPDPRDGSHRSIPFLRLGV